MKHAMRWFFVAALGLAGCNFPTRGGDGGHAAGPQAWIDRPLEGSGFLLGDTVPIVWHASGDDGLRRVEVQVNGETMDVVDALQGDLDPDLFLVEGEFVWTPDEAGEYLLQIVPTGPDDAEGAPAENRITVFADGGSIAGAVYADLNEDEDADDPGEGPLEGVTVILVECTEKLSLITTANGGFRFENLPFGTDCRMDFDKRGWLTTGTFPAGIDLPIHVSPRLEPAVFSVFLSPAATPTPTLTPTSTVTLTPTVTRTPLPTNTPLPDKDPPPKPAIISPKAEVLDCLNDIVLRWSEVSDPSGIDYYEVTLKVDTGGANFVTVGMWELESSTSINVNAQTDCGNTYGWYVRARDNAGNWGGANYALFGLDLP